MKIRDDHAPAGGAWNGSRRRDGLLAGDSPRGVKAESASAVMAAAGGQDAGPSWEMRGRGVPGAAVRPGTRRILVPVEFGAASRVAVEHAARLANWLGASIVLLHVVERKYAEGFVDAAVYRNPVRQAEEERARRNLWELAESLRRRGIAVRWVLGGGVAKREILRIAARLGVSLIVLAQRRRTAVERLLSGSISRHVVDGARCPVLVIPEGWNAAAEDGA